jgi:hypothetical protein
MHHKPKSNSWLGMFIIYAFLFFGIAGLLAIRVSARAAAVYSVLLGAAVIAGWIYHHEARPGYALMGWYGHATANGMLVGFLIAVAAAWCGVLFESRKSATSRSVRLTKR